MTQAVHFIDPTGVNRIGRLDGDVIVDAGLADRDGFVPDAAGWEKIVAASGATYALVEVRLLPPVVPTKILAIGLNYRSHVTESEVAYPDVPVVFAKFPSSLNGPFDDIVIPREETRPDFEAELGVVIGKKGYRIRAEDAWDHVGGYTVVHDVSGRRAQLETPMRQFTLGKSFDTFTPIGPSIVSPDAVDLDKVTVRMTISGEVMQDAHIGDLIFDIPFLVEYLSRGVTLQPGDLIATGTPGGVGDARTPPRYLVDGDVAEASVSGVGTIRNRVRREV